MSVIIKLEWLGGREAISTFGGDVFLKDFDHEAGNGHGLLTVTKKRDEAKVFESGMEAMEFWRKQSVTKPLRPDGKPNRPLTAFTISIEGL